MKTKRSRQVVPLLKLTQSENGLHQFEACMALTNIASISEEIRTFMLNHDAFQNLQVSNDSASACPLLPPPLGQRISLCCRIFVEVHPASTLK